MIFSPIKHDKTYNLQWRMEECPFGRLPFWGLKMTKTRTKAGGHQYKSCFLLSNALKWGGGLPMLKLFDTFSLNNSCG